MVRTCLTEFFDLSCPILSAGLPFVGCPALVAAVSNAGGMGFLGGDLVPPSEVTNMIRSTRRLTNRPFGVSFSARSVTGEHLKRCADERPAVVALSRGQPDMAWMDACKRPASRSGVMSLRRGKVFSPRARALMPSSSMAAK